MGRDRRDSEYKIIIIIPFERIIDKIIRRDRFDMLRTLKTFGRLAT